MLYFGFYLFVGFALNLIGPIAKAFRNENTHAELTASAVAYSGLEKRKPQPAWKKVLLQLILRSLILVAWPIILPSVYIKAK
jgi:hypothetical protein